MTTCEFVFEDNPQPRFKEKHTLNFEEWQEMYRTGAYKGRKIRNLTVGDFSVDFIEPKKS